MSLEEVRKLPPVTEEEAERYRNFKEDFTDPECPPSTDEQLAQFKRSKDLHPDMYKTVGLE